MTSPAACRSSTANEGWVDEVLRTGHVLAFPDVRADPNYGVERYEGVLDVAGHLTAPLIHHDRVIGALSAVTREPRGWTSGDVAFISTLATHAAIALSNAELFEQTVARAAQLEVLQAASARLSQAGTIDEIGRTIVEETHGIIDYHNARVYLIEPPDQVVPIAFEGRVGAYEQVDMSLLTCTLGEGFTGWVAQHGEPILVNDANRDPRGATIAGDRRRRRIDARRPDALRRPDHRGHHPFQARPRRVRVGRPAPADDPRRPGGDRRRLGPAAAPDPGPGR